MGMDARGGVHRRHDAAPDDHAREARRQEGRHADRDGSARGVQHRRLWQPRQRDPGRGDGEPDRGLSLRQQEGHRPGRLHQHDAGRRLPRLRRLADHLRHRMRDRRPRPPARRRCRRAPPQERGAAGRQRRIDLAGAGRRELRQPRHRRVPRHRPARAEEGQRRRQARRRRLAGGQRQRARHAGMRPADRAPVERGDAPEARRHLSPGVRHVGVRQRHLDGDQADLRQHPGCARQATYR